MNNKLISYRQPALVVLFVLTAGPGPILFFLNPYTITFLPLVFLAGAYYLYQDELRLTDWNAILRSQDNLSLIRTAIQWGIYAHAINYFLMYKVPGSPMTNTLLAQYPMMALNAALFGPVIEEVVYRKIIFGSLIRMMSFWPSAILSSIIFALAHFSVKLFLAYAGVGLVLCWVYRKSGSLLPPILVHAALNIIGVAAMTLQL
ncbi:CPBP family intramembrane glutamic endopeptidase [Paenibacillus sp. YYML68]|uniref:CPBP family intramembrane glutamic endopeptidase n=1 Tax=Paenibacillus sp. YYML68 TaxID=2909250 RepID=UPI00248FDBAF|nr:CPBP family intramembrane glutamic endopeptidase [Paenibacillus sp. YYML68]